MSPPQDGKHSLLLFVLYISAAMTRTDLPCSSILHFAMHKFERVGIIELPISNIKNPMKLNVQLAVQGTLPTRYVGQIELVSAENLKVPKENEAILKTVKFRVRFPTTKPLLFIKSISVNDRQLCDGNLDIFSYFGPVVTEIKLQYMLRFPHQNVSSSSHVHVDSDKNNPNKSYVSEICGSSNFSFGESEISVKKSDWPWLVTVNVKSKSSERFRCSGSLITVKHVITAAHCVANRQEEDAAHGALIVYLGIIKKKFKLSPGVSEYRKVSNVHINPFFKEDGFNANMAVLELSEPTPITEYIQPACLWRTTPNLPPISEADGVVALWIVDIDGSLLETSPNFIQVQIKKPEECALEGRNSYSLCSVAFSELNWCPGAYGGELLIRQKDNSSDPRWWLRGVMQFPSETERCTVSKQLLFSDVTIYLDWLAQIIE